MALVEKDEMTILRSAADSKSTAATAGDDIQLKAVAYAINSAANCGQLSVVFQEELRSNVTSELESKGYELRKEGVTPIERSTLISWK